MRAGRLRHRVTVEQAVPARDSMGDETVTWSAYATRWAGVEPVSGAEFWTTQQETGTQQIRVVLRHDSLTAAITPKMRINFGGRLYDIQDVIVPDERRREVQVMCTWRHLPEVYP